MVFRDLFRACPDVVAGEVDVLPAERGQVEEELIGNLLDFTEGGDSTFKIAGVPQDDRGDEEVQTGRPMLLVLVCAVPDFTKPVDEDRPSQAVARLTFVEFAAGPRRSSGSSSQLSVASVRSSRPSSRSAAATPFWRGYDASWRRMSEAVTVPVRMEAATRRMSGQCARISATLMRPAISGSSEG